jgi:hypothetical protein
LLVIQDLLARAGDVGIESRTKGDGAKSETASLSDAVAMIKSAPRVVLVGLHACGGLTDAILALSLRLGAGVLCATCCFTKNVALRVEASELVSSRVASSELVDVEHAHDSVRLAYLCFN